MEAAAQTLSDVDYAFLSTAGPPCGRREVVSTGMEAASHALSLEYSPRQETGSRVD